MDKPNLKRIIRNNLVFKPKYILSVLTCIGLWSPVFPAFSQAVLPYSVDLQLEQLEQAGIEMAEDAIQLARFQRLDAAISRAKLSTQLAPQIYQTWFILGSLYLQQNQIEPGIEALLKAQNLQPKEANIKFSLGSAYFQKGDYKSAITHIEDGLKIKPDTAPALFDLGNSLLRLERYPEAITAYEKAIKVNKDFWPAINNIGLIKYEQGNTAGAIEQWQKALKIDKEQAEPMLAIAVGLYKQGKTDEALKMGKTALNLDSRYSGIKFLEENLWGKNLIQDTEKFLSLPSMKALLLQLENQPAVESGSR